MEIFHCDHVPHPVRNFCTLCGGYVLKSLYSGVKTSRFVDPFPSSQANEISRIQERLKSFKTHDEIVLSKDVSSRLS
jgi:cyclophilin family peptidyl-prolyl cis-trans isomerase